MKIAIVGVGAIGGYVAARLGLAGEDITLIARGATLKALQQRGLRLINTDGSEEVLAKVRATDDYAAAGHQDVVILGMKAHQVVAVAPEVPKLLGSDTVVVPMQNGIPYWYFHEHGGALAGTRVHSVDPDGVLEGNIPPARVIGCVVYPATELTAPGVIKHVEGNRFPLGEPSGMTTERAQRLSECFARAKLKAPVLPDIRAEIWLKLWGNMTFNPISALTGATLAAICQYAPTRALAAAVMTEAQSVAHKLGITFRVPLERRIEGAEKVGHHKTSMLLDAQAGRALEVDALVGAVVEMARLTDTATPHLDAVNALTKLLAKTVLQRGTEDPAARAPAAS
jgi:2-dehydropantoate 2-reductase